MGITLETLILQFSFPEQKGFSTLMPCNETHIAGYFQCGCLPWFEIMHSFPDFLKILHFLICFFCSLIARSHALCLVVVTVIHNRSESLLPTACLRSSECVNDEA